MPPTENPDRKHFRGVRRQMLDALLELLMPAVHSPLRPQKPLAERVTELETNQAFIVAALAGLRAELTDTDASMQPASKPGCCEKCAAFVTTLAQCPGGARLCIHCFTP